MPIQKLRDFLDARGVDYHTISHQPAYTSQDSAASAHIPGREMAKTVMVTIDGRLAMAVLPALCSLDFAKLASAAGSDDVRLASEGDFADMFPGCEVGAMPPFGHLYGMKTYLDPELAEDRELVFTAGSHQELLRMLYRDYERLEQPVITPLSASVR
ncbi:aminoacyl-tRNA deacylase [Prosthecochloris sp. CIB 2401]|uniref:aminoacyl-tRNA deacylase n=1 Tax=Prosthecochloris sp. CIB 2401 TaxID=1868325 RepID=UPI00080AB694|nr:YbaK/EbsC family protein [Prosthecochloris sp. CIB 2401]ANT65721.1 YbaK/EbsC protein [Prosthecochloris sp. CIB 2401]